MFSKEIAERSVTLQSESVAKVTILFEKGHFSHH